MTATTFSPLDPALRDLIDTLLADARPVRQIAEHPDGARLRQSLTDIAARDYLASHCTGHAASLRVLLLASALTYTDLAAEQAPAIYTVCAWAALALDRRTAAAHFALLALAADPDYRLAHMIAEAIHRGVPARALRESAAATRQRLTEH